MIIVDDKLDWPLWLKGGYEWREVELPNGESEWFLAILSIPKLTRENFKGPVSTANLKAPRSYCPLQNKSLLNRFANIDISNNENARNDILNFVETFGHLGLEDNIESKSLLSFSRESTDPDENLKSFEDWLIGESERQRRGESFCEWMQLITDVRKSLNVYSCIRSGDDFEMPTNMRVELAKDVYPDEYEAAFDSDCMDSFVSLLKMAAEIPVERQVLQTSSLMEVCSIIKNGLETDISPVIEMNDTADGINFRLSPSTLRGAILFHLVRLYSSGNNWKACGHCGDVFEAKNTKAQYCSQSHQQMAHRKRKNAKT